jgi:hypothetical protein
MRKWITLALLAGAVAVGAVWPATRATAQGKTTRLSGLQPGLAVTIVDSGAPAMNAAVGAAGDLELALDPTKHFVVYRRDCSRYEVVVQGSEADRRCKDDAAKDPPQPGENCGRCDLVGLIFNGTYTAIPTASTAPSGGSHRARRIGVGAAAAAGIGAAIAVAGGDSSTTSSAPPAAPGPPPLTSFANTTWEGTFTKTSDTCGTFGNPAVIRMVIATANADGTVTMSVIHVSANSTTFAGTGRLALQGDGTVIITSDPALTGTLRSRIDGRFDSARSQLTGATNIVDRQDGSCGANYGGGGGQMNKVG